ncbi:MAG: YkuS family protein [Dethiobacteria bacterium]
MMKVAVSADLSHVKEYLATKGMKVVDLDEHLPDREGGGGSAIVVSGADSDLMGMADVEIAAPVINADGLSTAEVLAEVREKGRLRQ